MLWLPFVFAQDGKPADGCMRQFFRRIPKGFCNKAQGCEERATLGSRARSVTTLNGLRPTAAGIQHGHNPVGVVKHRPPCPRVARPSQPWALLRNPVGILSGNVCQIPGYPPGETRKNLLL